MPPKEKDDGKDKDGAAKGTRRILKKGLFAKDLGPMMYGFGDDHPSADTVTMMEELLIDHITEVCGQAQRVSTNRGKIKVDDFKFALRKDPKKLARVDELLFMAEDIARARGKDDLTQFAEEEAELAKKNALAGGGAVVAAPEPAAPSKGKSKSKKA
ncbi:hypothetical protein RQP46_000282 [Phenoliferia psychrophenolica]